jgi:hypothetical protein
MATYQLIATASGSSTSSYIFTNIPQTFQDLRIVASARSTNGANAWIGFDIGFNGGGIGTNVIFRRYIRYVTGGSQTGLADTSGGSVIIADGTSTSANHYGVGIVYIKGYSDTDKYKPFGFYSGNTTNDSSAYLSGSGSGQFRSNSAITSIQIDSGSSYAFEPAGKFYLYGIKTS